MAHYKYVALSKDGAKVSGVIESFSELDAAIRIKESCSVILKLTEVRRSKSAELLNLDIGGGKPDSKAVGMMCSQFAIILESGIPIARAVKLVADKSVNKPIQRMLDKVFVDVESGRSLSAAFAEHGEKILPVTFIETLRAGEATGNLARSFHTMQEQYDKESKMHAKVKGALAYPMFVLFVAVVVVIVLMAKVVPTFTAMFADMGAQLPAPTRALIAISDFFKNNLVVILAVILGAVLLVKVYGTTEEGRINLAKIKLKLPILGNIEELNAASQFANTMTGMLAAGLPMTKAVSITARVIDNYHLSVQTGKLCEELESGNTLGASMKAGTDYPAILVDMTGVGENSGEPEKTLRTVAQYYDQELEEATTAALAKLEPALLIGLAAIAGFIVISVFLAMFSMYGAMGNM